MRAATLVCALLLLVPPPDTARAQEPVGPDATVLSLARGSTTQIDWDRMSVRGELLGVSADSVWIEVAGALQALPLSGLERVRVQRHAWTARRVLVWSLVAGVGSTVALTFACQSVEDAECGGFTVAWLGAWALIGGLSGASLARSSHLDVPVEAEALRRFARFPQGLPERFRRSPR